MAEEEVLGCINCGNDDGVHKICSDCLILIECNCKGN